MRISKFSLKWIISTCRLQICPTLWVVLMKIISLLIITTVCVYIKQMIQGRLITNQRDALHDDVIKWKHFPRYWPFVRGIHRSPVKSPHKGHWRGALLFSLICAWRNGWVNKWEAGDLRRHRALLWCHCYAEFDWRHRDTQVHKLSIRKSPLGGSITLSLELGHSFICMLLLRLGYTQNLTLV